MKRYFFFVLGCIATLEAFEEKPWLGNQWEFFLDTSYSYSRFNKVSKAVHQLHSPFNENLLSFDFGFDPIDGWEAVFEFELAGTTAQSFGRRSVALMARTRWLDDIIGDPVSLTTGVSARLTSHSSLHDISCPSSARWDFEAHSAVGKEWDTCSNWKLKCYGLAALGQGSWGLPWLRAKAVFDARPASSCGWEIYSLGYFGFGGRHRVNINIFDGWGKYSHRSIDLGLACLYFFDFWGHLRLDVFYRLYAYVYPQALRGFMFTYHLPFSFF